MIPVSVDSETHIVQPGLLAPPIVCGTFATSTVPTEAEIMLREAYLDALEELLRDRGVLIVGSNFAFDLGCAAAARPHLLKPIFDAYDDGRIFDLLVAQALIDIASGMLFKDPVTFAPFRRYSQGMLEERYLGIHRTSKVKLAAGATASDEEVKKGVGTEDDWRLRYALLDGVPLAEWPEKAITYPKEDAAYALAIYQAQAKIGTNLSQMQEQARAAWALHLSAIWGVRTDHRMVGEVIAEMERGHLEAIARFSGVGFLNAKGKKSLAIIKRHIALAYGVPANSRCAACGGTGKGVSAKTKKPIQCKTCDATGLAIEKSPIPRADKGGIKADRDTLKESGDEQLAAFALTGENEKNWTTYRPILLQGVHRPINPEVNVLLVTGRYSLRNPNLTQQPRKGRIRECYVPRQGITQIVEVPDDYQLQPGEEWA